MSINKEFSDAVRRVVALVDEKRSTVLSSPRYDECEPWKEEE
jgi:hypothetical protein